MLTTEELMKPRYKVIADWPFNKSWRVGQIAEGDKLPLWDMGAFPHLFLKLQWWQDREPEDMPAYVKPSKGKGVHKAKFDFEESSAYFMFLDGGVLPFYPDENYWLPATEQEYLQFINQQQPNE